MDPDNPTAAQQIVTDYARLLERQTEAGEWPAQADTLPYPKRTIKSAIRTAVVALSSAGQLTDELRQFLQEAYVSLADYIEPDLARLMTEYQRAGIDLSKAGVFARDRMAAEAWRTVADTGALVGEVARSIAEEALVLQDEFQSFAAQQPAC